MKRAEELIEESKAQVSVLKDEEQVQYNMLESTISDLVTQQASRARQVSAHRASDLSGGYSYDTQFAARLPDLQAAYGPAPTCIAQHKGVVLQIL